MFARVALALAAPLAVAAAPTPSARPKSASTPREKWVALCKDWDRGDQPGPPFKIYGNTYYVGTCGISAILIAGDKGNILIDGGPEDVAEVVAGNIGTLGFHLENVKILLQSHAHSDHVGALARLKYLTGAQIWSSPAAARAIGSGTPYPDDPQYELHHTFPTAWVDKVLKGDPTVTLGNLALHGFATPGHTPGALTWQWRSCEGDRCKTIVYADSLTAVSGDHYRFSDHPAYLAQFRASLDKVAALDCDILLSPHPSAARMRDKLAKGDLAGPPRCKAYADGLRKMLDERITKEAGEAGK